MTCGEQYEAGDGILPGPEGSWCCPRCAQRSTPAERMLCWLRNYAHQGWTPTLVPQDVELLVTELQHRGVPARRRGGRETWFLRSERYCSIEPPFLEDTHGLLADSLEHGFRPKLPQGAISALLDLFGTQLGELAMRLLEQARAEEDPFSETRAVSSWEQLAPGTTSYAACEFVDRVLGAIRAGQIATVWEDLSVELRTHWATTHLHRPDSTTTALVAGQGYSPEEARVLEEITLTVQELLPWDGRQYALAYVFDAEDPTEHTLYLNPDPMDWWIEAPCRAPWVVTVRVSRDGHRWTMRSMAPQISSSQHG